MPLYPACGRYFVFLVRIMTLLKSILIVDDSFIITERLTEMILPLSKPVKLLSCSDYSTAVEAIQLYLPSIVILDINMPGKNGIELLQFIRKNNPDMIVIMFSNRADEYYRDICKKIGAHYFFDKSGEFDMLLKQISALL